MVYLVQIVWYSFEIYGIFGTVYQYILYIWYIWYSISVYLVQIVWYSFEIYGIFGTVYQYIWYRLSSTALKYMVYLVQYISIFHWIRFNVMPGATGCMCPLQASSNGTSESQPLNGER